MKIKCLILFVSLSIASCSVTNNTNKEWKVIFNENNVTGTFVLYDISSKEYKYYNKERAGSLYIPASTFKILNSLVALEKNVISDENKIIKWDGVDKGWNKWNKDQNMKSAIYISCVWFYQELARRIGAVQMQKWIDKVEYGNKLMGGKVDNFWLEGDLKISAIQQIKFIERLINNELPFAAKNQEIVKRIMITDSTKNYVIHSKTGWAKRIGWIVGYIEKADNDWIFALNIDINKKYELNFRKKILYKVLENENIIKSKYLKIKNESNQNIL